MRWLVVAVLLLSACGGANKRAEEIVRHDMLDPDAANFREVKTLSNGYCVSGEVNLKNRMGAYTGFRPFIVDTKSGRYAVLRDTVSNTRMGEDAMIAATRMKVILMECGEPAG